MIKTPVLVNGSEVGFVATSQEIKGSIINDFGVSNLVVNKSFFPDIKALFDSALTIPGSPRLQRVWNFSTYNDTNETLTIGNTIFRPDGMCVACAGSGKYRAKTHKSTAKCPSCKGSGYIKNSWIEEIKEDAKSNVVGERDNATPVSSTEKQTG